MDQPQDLERPLDPEDWPAFRQLCHEMLDSALDHVEQVDLRPVWTPVPQAVKDALDAPLPLAPQAPREICDDIRRLILPYGTGNIHPRFFGWVHGAGTAGGMLAELMAAAMNCNLGGREHSRVYVERQVSLTALREAISADRAAGRLPFCVIGTAGSVNCGAIDDLAGLADIRAEEDLWLHVDGAFGALAIMSETLKPRLGGIERADSLAFDFHKWAHVPYDAGCILIRDETLHRETFSSRHAYPEAAPRGLAGGTPWFCDYAPELSRGFRALKVWFTLKEHGTARLGEAIDRNCRQARYLAARIDAHPRLKVMAPVGLNIVCFRYCGPDAAAEDLNRLNAEIVADLHELGIAAPSTTRLGANLVIRVNITNHRSRLEDFDRLVDAVAALGMCREAREDPTPAIEPAGLARWTGTQP